ncbi:decarboxylating NADP(+)-dependent phosphogluconate dehydrogenase [bacterium]|nr:decarboxylating NADP(+)-dependent phosphogluconate dehydrogenase [bacterium]
MDKLFDIGMIGLGVMGENLSMNMINKGFSVSVYDIIDSVIDNFVTGRGKGLPVKGCHKVEDLVKSLKTPRKIMIMIKAGSPVDQTLDKLLPFLEKGDIVIDGGNSNFNDTIRRAKMMEDKGLRFIGMGVSGGEEGALNGPSLMPGGTKEAWEHIKEIYTAIAAKIDTGEACCSYIGEGGAGHYVKMVHNGIEYGDMELICESYDLMRKILGLSSEEISKIFTKWNEGKLNSYLVEITSNILKYKDENGEVVVEKILDAAGQKGTGKWASISALDEGTPLTLITEAVYQRCLSAHKEDRVAASKVFNKTPISYNGTKEDLINDIEKALYVSKIMSYAQGFSLLKEAAKTYEWNLDYGAIALTWRGGCIIRSSFLGKINEAYKKNPSLENLMLDDYFKNEIDESVAALRRVIATAVLNGIPVPSMSAGLAYFDGYKSEMLPQNLLQAQRDYFGAHTYERVDKERGEHFHTNWTGHGGKTTAGTYNA